VARYKSDIITTVQSILRDEFEEGVTSEWEPDELGELIEFTLNEIEQKMPYEAKVTAYDALSTVATELSATATNLEVASDDDFPTTYPFYITIEDEVLSVTALASADNFTVARAKNGSTAAVHAVGKDVGLTIVTASDSKDINLTNISNLIRLRRNRPCEYPIGYNPRRFRNATVFAKVMSMEIDTLPSALESVYVYCLKKHTLTDASSTLEPQHEYLLIMGVAARAAISRGREQLNALNVGGVNVGPRMVQWGQSQLNEYKGLLKSHALKDSYEALPRT
jgi:hypothetical protein